jgi:hypothetical protein
MRTGSFYWMCPSHDENYLLLLDWNVKRLGNWFLRWECKNLDVVA